MTGSADAGTTRPDITPRSARLLPAIFAHRWAMCPLRESDRTLTLAVVREPDEATVRIAARLSGRDAVFEHVSDARIFELLAECYAESPQPHRALADHVIPEPPDNARVLLAEDDMIQRMLARAFLESGGLTVIAASDGQDALDVLADPAHGVNAVVTDLQMPRCSGEQLVRATRATGHRDLPIIVLPATGDPAVTVPLLDAGASDYFAKPMDAVRFPARVRAAIIRRLMVS